MTGLVLATTPRSASTLLCDLLRQTGVAGRPESWFHRPYMPEFARERGLAPCGMHDFGTEYLKAAKDAGTDASGRFGLRIMWREVSDVTTRLATLFPEVTGGSALLEAAFGPLAFVHLTRRDKAAQAVSRVRAERSGLWHLNADGTERERLESRGAMDYDADALRHYADRGAVQDAKWQAWFKAEGVDPLIVSYEDLADDPTAQVVRILTHIGAHPDAAERIRPQTRKIADATSAAWLARFRTETDR